MNNPVIQKDSFLSANGRFGRMSYLGWNALIGILFLCLYAIIYVISPNAFEKIATAQYPLGFIIPMAITYIATVYLMIIFAIKRLHDRNLSGWLALILLVPLIGTFFILFLVFAQGDANVNSYGAPRPTKTWEKILAWIYIALMILSLVAILIALVSQV